MLSVAMRFLLREDPGALDALADRFDALAERTPSPFLSHAWLGPWWEAFGGSSPPVCASLEGPDGPEGLGLLQRTRTGLRAAANAHSGDWDVAATGDEARLRWWTELGGAGPRTLALGAVPAPHGLRILRRGLRERGWRAHATLEQESPFLELGPTWDEQLGAASANLRSQVRRRTRNLEKAGRASFRTVDGGPGLDAAITDLLRVEATGWKAAGGTAILGDPAAERLYRTFAHNAAERGWLRIHLLELDGEPIAGDLGCVLGGVAFLVKTGFDDNHSRLSPGLVLRAKVLESCIEEGARGYDFLGGPDHYKLRWATTLRPRVTVRAFRGSVAAAAGVYRTVVRPARARLRRG